MNHVEKKRLIKLADFLDKLPRKKFDFGHIVKGYDKPRKTLDCGSVACAIGWCPVIFPRLVKYAPPAAYSIGDYEVIPKDGACEGAFFGSTERLFGIDREEALGLFEPGEQDRIDLPFTGNRATPKQVAKNIRRFIKWKEKQ